MRIVLSPLGFVCLFILAGCAERPSPMPPSDASQLVPAVPEPSKLEIPILGPEVLLGRGAGEPNVAIAPDGTIYVTPIDHLYRSKDGGKTFEDLGTEQTDGHGDGDIAVDASGRLHWLGLFGSNDRAIPYQYSDNQGTKFSRPVDVSNGTGADRQWLDVTPDGHVFAAWRDEGQIPGPNERYAFAMSKDGGTTWGPKVTVRETRTVGGPLVHDPGNPTRLYIPFVTFGGPVIGEGNPTLLVSRSDDEGTTWKEHRIMEVPASPADPTFTAAIFPVVAVDEDGTVYLTVSIKQDLLPAAVPKAASLYGVYLFVSKDRGETWTAPQLLSSPLKAAIMPWVAAGKGGRIAVAWYENVMGLPNEVLPDFWNVKLLEALRMDGPVDQQERVLVQLNGEPNHIGSVCTNGGSCLAGGDRSLLDFFELAIGPNGHPTVAWASSPPGITAANILTVLTPVLKQTDIYTRTVASGTPLR